MVDTSTFWTVIASLSVFANRIAEGVKRALKVRFPAISEDWIGLISIITSFLAALLGALFLRLNVFDILPPNPYTPNLPPLIGIMLAAAVAAFGSEGLHWLLDLLEAGTKRIEAPAAGGFSQETKTKFIAPAPDGAVSTTVSTPAGSATVTPSPPAAVSLPADPPG